MACRPGDHLVFNPLEYHCCSFKMDEYEDTDMYAMSLYLKTANVGCNDNSIELTLEQGAALALASK